MCQIAASVSGEELLRVCSRKRCRMHVDLYDALMCADDSDSSSDSTKRMKLAVPSPRSLVTAELMASLTVSTPTSTRRSSPKSFTPTECSLRALHLTPSSPAAYKTDMCADLDLEVKLLQYTVDEMQANVNNAATRIAELRGLVQQLIALDAAP
ncbi:hypothetical protein P43SY_008645 [Pythium insidiosum]|uniref:Uncharacterized protein n=1 Tax=Pythium insidiosum TaxID=114742 RepID=A0AAD5LYU2_PYTIN|nr:hypothetical protein P43SY_008645 [Pythium insidiosum]